jgi:predicted nucleic acid-binding protein
VKVILDSDIVIEVLRARDLTLLAKWSALIASSDEAIVSPVTVAEIWEGARAQEYPAISLCFSYLGCVSAEYATGEVAGALLRQYKKSHGLEIADALIAAAAIQNQAALWTRNRKHYPMKNLTFY